MTKPVEFPSMRSEVISALRSLSDRAYQEARWGRVEPGVNFFDNLTLNIHTLYDDCCVLPEPESRLGTVLLPADVDVLLRLHAVLWPILADLGEKPDAAYLQDPRWGRVLNAAKQALAVMTSSDLK